MSLGRLEGEKVNPKYLVDGHQTVQSFEDAEFFHVWGDRLGPMAHDEADLFGDVNLRIVVSQVTARTCRVEILRYMFLQLCLDPVLPLAMHSVGVVVVVIDGSLFAILDEFAQFVQSILAALLQCAEDEGRPWPQVSNPRVRFPIFEGLLTRLGL